MKDSLTVPKPFTPRLSYTTVKEFVADPMLIPVKQPFDEMPHVSLAEFVPEKPWPVIQPPMAKKR